MLNLVEKNLSVSVPLTVLKKMGDIDGTESIQSFFLKAFAQAEHAMTDEQKKQIAEYKPYLANSVFLPIIVTNMVERSINFTEALEVSQSEIRMNIFQMQLFLGMMDMVPESFEMFESVIGELVGPLSEISTTNSNTPDAEYINCPIEKMSPKFCAALESLGIIAIGEKVSGMEKVKSTLQVNLIEPVFNAIINCVLAEEHMTEEDMNAEDKAEIKTTIEMVSEVFKQTFPLQTVLSTVLTKAIENDITMAEAMATFEEDQLIESTLEKIIFSKNLAKYSEQIEKALGIIHKLS